MQTNEWATDFEFPLAPASEVFPKATSAKVQRGWLSVCCSSDEKKPYCKTSAREQVIALACAYDKNEFEMTVLNLHADTTRFLMRWSDFWEYIMLGKRKSVKQ